MKKELYIVLMAGFAAVFLSACDLSGKRQASLEEASAPAPAAMSPEQFRKALRSASVILVDRLPSQAESDKAAEGLAGYETVIRQFVEDPGFLKVTLPVPDVATTGATITGAIKRYHDAFFESSGPMAAMVLRTPAADQMAAQATLPANFLDANESTNMALYIIKNNLDYRTILTMNQCVNSRLELGPCATFIPKTGANPAEITRTWQQVLDTQATEAAGVLSTRKFLSQFDAPFYFRRVHKAFNFFACRTYPDPDDLGMPASDMSTTIYRWDEMNKPVQTERCYECHSNLNPRTAMFFPFDRNGFFRGGTAAAHFNPASFTAQYPNNSYPNNVRPQTPDNAVATLDVLLKNSPATRPALYGGQPITRLKDFALGISNSKHFKTCMVQRFANFLLGYEPRTSLGSDLSPLVEQVETSNYNVKEIIVKIATSQAFLLRQ